MKKVISLAIVCFFLLAGAVYSEDKPEGKTDKPRIAVMDLEAKGVVQDDADAVADFLRTDLLNTEKFTVIERSRMQDIIKEQHLSMTGLTETEKAAKLGKILNCKFILVGTLSKLGSQYFLNVRAVDVETGETKLGKREKSNTVEEMSEVSKVIASQLAGVKVEYKSTTPSKGGIIEGGILKGGGGVTEEEAPVTYNSPPLGFDFQIGFTPNHIYYVNDVGEYTDPSGKSISTTYISSSAPTMMDIKAGFYMSILYFGFMNKATTLDQGKDITITASQSSSYQNSFDYSGEYTAPATGYKETITDLMLGLRLYKSGNNLLSSIFYFTWQTIKFEEPVGEGFPSNYSGPGIGMIGRVGGSKGCCGMGGASIISPFMDYAFYAAYIKYTGTRTLSDPITGVSFGGELGFGIMFNKIGLYVLANYSVDGRILAQKGETTISGSNAWWTYTKDQTVLNHGSEVRMGFNFDLQTLLH